MSARAKLTHIAKVTQDAQNRLTRARTTTGSTATALPARIQDLNALTAAEYASIPAPSSAGVPVVTNPTPANYSGVSTASTTPATGNETATTEMTTTTNLMPWIIGAALIVGVLVFLRYKRK